MFLLRSLGYVRLFDPVIRGLLERGHRVHLLHEREKYTEQELGWLRELEQQPGFSWSLTDALYHDRWAGLANVLRRTTDYVHFRGPAFAGASPLVTRAEGRAHLPAQRLMRSRFMRIEAVRRTFWRTPRCARALASEQPRPRGRAARARSRRARARPAPDARRSPLGVRQGGARYRDSDLHVHRELGQPLEQAAAPRRARPRRRLEPLSA